jgi:hypothetical protein
MRGIDTATCKEVKRRLVMKAKRKRKADLKVAINVLIEPQQKAALEQLGSERQRPVGFLVREAINQYLASPKKKG